MGYYKYQTTKLINAIRQTPANPVWQRLYYDRIIRTEIELYNVRGNTFGIIP